MINSFDLLDILFDIFIKDDELSSLLKIPTDLHGEDLLDVQNMKLRREYQTADVIKATDAPFVSYYFMHAEKVKTNWLVNKGDLYIDIYTHNMREAALISKRIRELISANIQAMLMYEGQHYSGVMGVYKYRLIYNPLIDGE